MKKLTQFTVCLAGLLLSFGRLHAQATLNSTTLNAALTGTDASATPGSAVDVISLTSCTNLVQNAVGQWTTGLYVDFEYMNVVREITASPCVVQAQRGASGTGATKHNSGATVYLGAPWFFGGSAYAGASLAGDKVGACISTNEMVLPVININDGKIFNCFSSGEWVQTGFGTMGTPPSQRVESSCSGTAGSAETEYLVGLACSASTTAVSRVMVSPGTLYGLRVFSSANVTGGTGKDVLTVMKNGSATAITCTVAGSAATCSDLADSVAVAAGDVISFRWVTATSDTAANVTASVEKQ